MMLRKNEREYLKITVQALNTHGIATFASIQRNGQHHIRVNFFLPDGRPSYVLLSNSTDVRARKNIYMNVKRAVAGAGRQRFQYRGGLR